jgi:DNA-binding sugar fermentation-stimulating protein
MLLYSLPSELVRATVVRRPSQYNKSPYLADILIDGQQEPSVAHTPALGCNGYVAPGQVVWAMPAANSKTISKYTIYHAEQDNEIICIHPQVANSVARALLESWLVVPGLRKIKSEVTVGDSRFDFGALARDSSTKEKQKVYIEVKSAPIADIVDALPRSRDLEIKKLGNGQHPKTAIFPHGNNPKEGLLSPRALKHIEHLNGLSAEARCVMLYLTMRTDVNRLTISTRDKVYREAVARAAVAGVQIEAWTVKWIGRHAYLGESIPVIYN